MHESVLAWSEERVAALGDLSKLDVLEVGSYDVNGSVRPFFDGAASYVGVDHAAGPSVDQVADACALPFANESFDVVVSTEMLEHCLRPWRAIEEMSRVLWITGTLILTCRGFNERGSFPFHNPPDAHRFSADALEAMCADAGFKTIQILEDPQVIGWFVTATKS